MLNTDRIAMITALAKRFRNIQITLGRSKRLKQQQKEQLDPDGFRDLGGTLRSSHFPLGLYLSASGSFD